MSKFVLVASLLLSACSRESAAPSSTTTEQASVSLPAGMSRVTDPSQVCMVNNQFMGAPQIPVQFEGRTYFGCCAMCKEKLETQLEARTAKDPVTGEQVDKAKAVIVKDQAGKVMYFASEDTLRRFRG